MAAAAPLDERFIKALAHPLRWRIVETLVERSEASPVELARALDQPLATVSHHVRVLRDLGSIELTRTEQRRGALEHYYRAVMPAFVDDEQWELIPKMLRRGLMAQLFRRILAEATTAGEKGAFDVAGCHMDRMIIELDEQGWNDASNALLDLLWRIQAIQSESDARRSGAAPTHVSELVVMHFDVAESMAPAEANSDSEALPERSPPIPASPTDS